jgi:hypothetical protein
MMGRFCSKVAVSYMTHQFQINRPLCLFGQSTVTDKKHCHTTNKGGKFENENHPQRAKVSCNPKTEQQAGQKSLQNCFNPWVKVTDV